MKASAAAAGRGLLTRAIDYAGLYPPAGLPMAQAVANYRRYLAGPDRWALGRFVCPVERLEEFYRQLEPDDGQPERWRLAAVARGEATADRQAIQAFNRTAEDQAQVDALEARTPDPAAVAARLHASGGLQLYCEVDPASSGWETVLDAVLACGAEAKLRTGGVTAAAIPPVERVLAFLMACQQRGLRFKATAGLHHAFAGRFPLTYAPDSPQAPMYGFVNLTLAVACLVSGDQVAAEQALRAATLEELRAAGREQVQAGRSLFTAFGSCSFEEPMQWLHQLS